ncbi:DUF4339 domain-containing protein [Chlorobium sp. KB01]|uniref:DUF4339 domain-containing protein n=1 Tax=Chlorobium sp. KB01 TaxID=1917528 RepID=UPI000975A254|nr:DUF4339 domain-containing protein [Chlorobium sp. KB01]
MLIHIKRNEEIFGPYSVEEARSYLQSGRLSLTDFAQMEGTSEWIPLASVPGLKSAPPPPALPSLATSPPPSGQSTPDSPVHFGYVIRDVIIVAVLTAIGGFAVGLASGRADMSSPGFVLGLAASNTLLGSVGFIIVGCLAKGNRWRHLLHVAVGVWLVGLLNVMIGMISFGEWFFSVFFVALIMGVGGGLSFAFKRQ